MNGFWMIWPGNPGLSAAIWVLVAMVFLYASRAEMHTLIRSTGLAISAPLRAVSRWLVAASDEMNKRNRAVLLAQGRQEVESRLEREFERVSVLVSRDLDGYPALKRKIVDEIARMEEDFKKCGEVPPPPPDWIEAAAAVSKVKSGQDVVQKILTELHASLDTIHDKALAEYRSAYKARHRILGAFLPFWRSVEKTMSRVDQKMEGLQASAAAIDAQMEKYREINARTDKATHTLAVSAFTQLVTSMVVMVVAVGGAFVNFKLIALPMSEMVGAADTIAGSLRTSEVAALVIILVEASMGLFVMETLGITHLFPPIRNLEDRMRRRLLWTSATLLVVLAIVEAALALMRDVLIADKQALIHSLATVSQAVVLNESWVGKIPMAGQMLLGFILPFALAFVAIPLESFINSLRTVGGIVLLAVVRLVAFLIRLLGHIARHGSRVLLSIYDVFIVLPLMVQRIGRRALPRTASELAARDLEIAKPGSVL
jgi:hypothetical protein